MRKTTLFTQDKHFTNKAPRCTQSRTHRGFESICAVAGAHATVLFIHTHSEHTCVLSLRAAHTDDDVTAMRGRACPRGCRPLASYAVPCPLTRPVAPLFQRLPRWIPWRAMHARCGGRARHRNQARAACPDLLPRPRARALYLLYAPAKAVLQLLQLLWVLLVTLPRARRSCLCKIRRRSLPSLQLGWRRPCEACASSSTGTIWAIACCSLRCDAPIIRSSRSLAPTSASSLGSSTATSA